MAKCKECDGSGEKFILPHGNPFHMKLPALARAMVKVRCFQCSGTGEIKEHFYGPGHPSSKDASTLGEPPRV
jgi:hypothetical protein